jgi:BirA family biotin operon repressor/biotin-[acetyl-CoA-carboxylase] ligase
VVPAPNMVEPVIHRLAAVGSTMDEARILAEAGALHGTAVMARIQTGGRGRSGRQWLSPAGNLYVTFVLRPGDEARRAPELGFVCALALAEAVDGLIGPGTALKWPNDVLLGGAKLAGILLERLADGAVLAGIGVNVALQPEGMPYPVTSLLAHGSQAGPDEVLDALAARLHAGWAAWQADGFGPVLARWRERGPAPGAALRVRLESGIVTGAFAGLGTDGSLQLETADGRRTLVAGDVLL